MQQRLEESKQKFYYFFEVDTIFDAILPISHETVNLILIFHILVIYVICQPICVHPVQPNSVNIFLMQFSKLISKSTSLYELNFLDAFQMCKIYANIVNFGFDFLPLSDVGNIT